MKPWKSKQTATTIFFLSLIGLAISTYSVLHYFGVTAGGWCNVNEVFNCDLVNKSAYAQLAGIPVSVIGLVGYFFLAAASYLKWAEQTIDPGLTRFLLGASSAGLLFSLYLTGIEAFVLRTFCPTCLISQASILLLFCFSLFLFIQEKR